MICPVCEGNMMTKVIQGVDINMCKDCQSIWLDQGKLKQLSGLDPEAGRVLSCIKCSNQMQTKVIKGVEIDICPHCKSIFLDQGELQNISGIDPDNAEMKDFMNELARYGIVMVVE